VIDIKVDIVGGSLSGLSAAISLKEHDQTITVFVHEKYKDIGYNPEGRRCGEAYRLEPQWNKWQPTKESIFNEIKKTELIIDDKKYISRWKPRTYMILNRQAFIRQLADTAEDLGVEILTNDKVTSVSDLDGKYIIDASGCPSTIKRELGLNKGLVGFTYQQTLEDTNFFNSDTVKIIVPGVFGFYWIFPRNPEKKEINIGIGIYNNVRYNLKEMLESFKKIQNVEGKINYTTGGLVPLGLQNPLKKRNILFIGDAGVGAFPLNGEGIYRALISGEIAGECIALGYSEKYPFLIERRFIKGDIPGKIWLRINYILERIGPKAVFALLKNNHIYTTATSSLKKFN
jgi:digeranylgeranylglycerophospholipid reductase